MTRRHVLLLGSVAVVVGLAVAWWTIQPPPSAINAENAAKIEKGMALAEVEAILGGPARDESTGPLAMVGAPSTRVQLPRVSSAHESIWHSDAAAVTVMWDLHDARCVRCLVTPVCRAEEGFLEKLRRRLRL